MTEYNTASMVGYKSTWEQYGYSGAGNVSSLINSCVARPAVICGSGKGVFEELDIVRDVYKDDLLIFGVSDVGMYIRDLDHWVSLHGDVFPAWKAVRWFRPVHEKPTRLHAYNPKHEADYHWHLLAPLFALSGYFAMQIAFLMGCYPIVLAGCPGDATPRFFESTIPGAFKYGDGDAPGDRAVREQIEEELKRVPLLKERVRAMSGWNKQLFGGL